MAKPTKYIVITSIFPPSDAVKKFADVDDWQLIVVGDKKTPVDWDYKNVIYLGPEAQMEQGFELAQLLPWNHYCRKMIGYLYAIRQGAELIADSDDDNLPYENWPSLPDENAEITTLSNAKFVNIYKYFSDEFVWPRGLPLTYILEPEQAQKSKAIQKVGVWQFLADGDPDVDAIYRLTNNKAIKFKDYEPIVLDKGVLSPFNSQNTIFKRDLFPLLFLPAFVTFRFTDILRGLVAQPILWQKNYKLGIGPATVFQERNPHNYLRDFESEVPVYLNSEKVCDIASRAVSSSSSTNVSELLVAAYAALGGDGIVTGEEVALVNAWVSDVNKLTSAS
jgi:hypothetical protein